MGSPWRCAVVGTGAIAGAHAEAIAAQGSRARLVTAVDVDEARAREFARTWDVPVAATDLAGVLGDVDLVHICTPPQFHRPLAELCLAAGVDVLVEKPPALSLTEVDALLRAEADSPASVSIVFQNRFGSAARQLRTLAADGILGRPLVATCETAWFRDDAYFAVPWRGSWTAEGGGPTMGHGIHQMDLLLSILGPWEEVTAMAGRQSRPTETEDVSCAVVRFANGALATVVNSLVSPQETSALRLDWEHATVSVRYLYGHGDDDWAVTPAPGHEALADAWAAGLDGERAGHAAQLREVLDALDAGAPPPVTLADARLTLELSAAVYASAFTGQRVGRGDIGPGHPFYPRMDGTGAPWAGDGRPTMDGAGAPRVDGRQGRDGTGAATVPGSTSGSVVDGGQA